MNQQVQAPAIFAHRSYRRLQTVDLTSLWVTIALLAVTEAVLVANLSELSDFFVRITSQLIPDIGRPLPINQGSYLLGDISWLEFHIEPMTYQEAWLWFAVSLVAARVLFVAGKISPPLRLMGSFICAAISLSALYLLYFGHLGFEGEAFSILYVRTSVIVRLLSPIMVGLLGLTMPFTSLERLGLVVLCWASIFALSAVRYALFIWALTQFGSVLMPSLYLFLGPVLDFVYLMSMFSLFLVPLGRRLDRGERSSWAWL
ncbi:MAG: hypothetical protein M3124_00800 [Actinomycetota bacterium]|nr:hypothetical protein [Actinomycetota bacterium]